jgi:hypothetical protein
MVNKHRFFEALDKVLCGNNDSGGIGVLGEKTVHAVLKRYYHLMKAGMR